MRRLVRDGARVAASSRTREDLDSLAAETGGAARAYPLDVTDETAVREVVERIEAEMGASISAILERRHPHAADFNAATVRRIMETNFMGTVIPRLPCCRASSPAVPGTSRLLRRSPATAACLPPPLMGQASRR